MTIPRINPDGSVAFDELYYITPIENVPSILDGGILSHKRVQLVRHADISATEVQDRREGKQIPNPEREQLRKRAITLHQYANLYIRPHNAMMYVRRDQKDVLCVLRIHPDILRRSGIVISDMNASKDQATFAPASHFRFSPESVQLMKEPLSYCWSDKNTPLEEKRKAVRQAEVEVPKEIHPSYVQGAFVANQVGLGRFNALFAGPSPIPVDVHPTLFFVHQETNDRGANPLKAIDRQPLSNSRFPILETRSPLSSDGEHE